MIIGDVFIMEEREFIDIVGADGTTQKMELIAIVESKKDEKEYLILTQDENIGDDVNIVMAYVYEEDGIDYIEVVKEQEEIDYVYSLLDEMAGEE
jgi:hypothetical protein